jgi:hypothetical protein
MNRFLAAILGVHTDGGPDAAGATSEDLLRETQAGPGGGPACVFGGKAPARPCRCREGLLGQGTDGNHSCGFGDCGAAGEDTAALLRSERRRELGMITSMRRLWPIGLVVVAAGCGSHHHARKVVAAKPVVTLPAAQVAALERRRRRELLEAHLLRDRAILENRRTLDSVPVLPGAVLESELDNAEFADEPSRRFVLRRPHGVVFEDDLLLAASGWGTFRIYRVPKATPSRAVVGFYVTRLRPRWQLVRLGRSYIRLRHADRCLWVRVQAQSARIEIGTDARVRRLGC